MKFLVATFLIFMAVGSTPAAEQTKTYYSNILSDSNLKNLLKRPDVIALEKKLDMSAAQSNFVEGLHIKYSFFDREDDPTITGLYYLVHEGPKSLGVSKPMVKLLFSIKPSNFFPDFQSYKQKTQTLESFQAQDLKLKQIDSETVEVDYLDASGIVRLAQWYVGSNLRMFGLYDQSGTILYLDTKIDEKFNHDIDLQGKVRFQRLERLPRNLFKDSDLKDPRRFCDWKTNWTFSDGLAELMLNNTSE